MDYEAEETRTLQDRDWWQALLPTAKLIGWSDRAHATFRKDGELFEITGPAASAIREAVEGREAEIREAATPVLQSPRLWRETEWRSVEGSDYPECIEHRGQCVMNADMERLSRALSGEK